MAIINHKINRLNDEGEVFESFNLYIPEDYTLGGSNVIIVKESATGDGGVVINNGRSQEEIPVNGTLFAVDTRKNVKSVVVSQGNSSNRRTTSLIPQGRNVEASERLDLLNSNMQKLIRIKDNGELIDFITPFKHRLGSNQYYIKDLRFTTQFDDSSVGFSMILSENRSANVLENDVSLGVKNGYFDALLTLLEQEQLGLTSDTTTDEVENEGVMSLDTYLQSQRAVVAVLPSVFGPAGFSINVDRFLPEWAKKAWNNFILNNNELPSNVGI